MKTITYILTIAGLVTGVQAATSLVSENFQSPFNSGNTSNPSFTGWAYSNSARTYSREESTENELPGDTDYTTNQALYFEYNDTADFALTHTWSSSDVFTLTFNSAGAAWEQTKERWARPRLVQSDGTVLWDPGATTATALGVWNVDEDGSYVWNGPGLYGNSTWQAESETQFSFTVNAADFTAGTEGETIKLQLGSSGQRGMYYDNVNLEVDPIPEPSAALLGGIGALLLLRRRK